MALSRKKLYRRKNPKELVDLSLVFFSQKTTAMLSSLSVLSFYQDLGTERTGSFTADCRHQPVAKAKGAR
jgi:hypothetical protein